MAYSAEVIQKARSRLAEAKAQRESENLRRLSQAYQAVPRLKQIDWSCAAPWPRQPGRCSAPVAT